MGLGETKNQMTVIVAGAQPNKRLKLTGGDRFKGIGVLCPGGHGLSSTTLAPASGRPQLKRDPLGADEERGMTAYLRPVARRRILAALTAFAIACGLATAPNPGTHYALLTVDGRRLPTWMTAQAPQDSVYPVILGQEFDVMSSSRMVYSVWVGEANRHADETFTYTITGCWQGFSVDYRQRADTLFLALAHDVTYFNAPTVPPVLLVDGPDLVQRTVASTELRYVPAQPFRISC